MPLLVRFYVNFRDFLLGIGISTIFFGIPFAQFQQVFD